VEEVKIVNVYSDKRMTDQIRAILDLIRQFEGEEKQRARLEFSTLLRQYDMRQIRFGADEILADLLGLEITLGDRLDD